MMFEHLAKAEKHLTSSRQIVARQRALVAELERAGHDTTAATILLYDFEQSLKGQIHHRDRILLELDQQQRS